MKGIQKINKLFTDLKFDCMSGLYEYMNYFKIHFDYHFAFSSNVGWNIILPLLHQCYDYLFLFLLFCI